MTCSDFPLYIYCSIIITEKIEIFITMEYDIVKNENGKDVIELKSYKFTHENRVNTHFKLTNLFNGNKALSKFDYDIHRILG